MLDAWLKDLFVYDGVLRVKAGVEKVLQLWLVGMSLLEPSEAVRWVRPLDSSRAGRGVGDRSNHEEDAHRT